MFTRIKTIRIVVLSVAVGFTTSYCPAQSTGPAALAAKQQIKTQVLTAMNDGKLSQQERRDILLKAKDILSAKEYVGLVETMNRLSKPERATPENLGYAPFTDKRLMAEFPTPDLSFIEKSPAVTNAISKFSIAKLTPNQNFIGGRTIKIEIVSDTVAKQPVAKTVAPKQSVAKSTTTKQSVAKKTKATSPATVVIISPPPEKKKDKQANSSTVSKTQNKTAVSDKPMPPMPPTDTSLTKNSKPAKPIQQKTAESAKKRPLSSDQATIQQPETLLNKAETPSSISYAYNDYSVPVLSSPNAALLSSSKTDTINTSFEQPIEPESSRGIISNY